MADDTTRDPILPALLIVGAVVFNAGMAFVNANIMPMTRLSIATVEIAIVATALLYALRHHNARMTPWYVLLGMIGLFAELRILAINSVDLKYFRDLLLVVTFIVLGLSSSQRRMIQAIVISQIFVVAGIVLEAVSLETYSSLFSVKQYYINTRGIAFDEFTNKASDLYVSATRPDARAFPFFDLHRLSSIFLEPVSLGNFAVISVAFLTALWPALGRMTRLFMCASILLTLFACDGRFSAMASLIIVAVTIVSRLIPRNAAVFYLPLVTLGAVAAVSLGDLRSGADDMPGRIAHTVELLGAMQLSDVLGTSDRLLTTAVDSGLAYLIITHSLVGVGLLWFMIVFSADEATPEQKKYKNAICLYIALSMMVSYSFVSIKTAAPLWFIYGALLRPRRAEAWPEPAQYADAGLPAVSAR
jgi:putative polymerase